MTENPKPQEPTRRSSTIWIVCVGLVLLGALTFGLMGRSSDHPGSDSCGLISTPSPEPPDGLDTTGSTGPLDGGTSTG